ncbi:MAG: Putative oxidoreductase, partial [uncultured Friedmanniella sp.]
ADRAERPERGGGRLQPGHRPGAGGGRCPRRRQRALAGDDRARLGPGAEHRQRLRRRHPGRDDSRRRVQGGAAGRVPRLRRGSRGDRRDGNAVLAGQTRTGGVEDIIRSLVGDELPWDQAQRELMRRHRPQSADPAADRTRGDRPHGHLPRLAAGVRDHRRRAPHRRRLRRRDPAV